MPILFAVYMLTQKQQLILFAPKTILLVIYFAGIGVLFPLAKPGILFEFEGYQLGVLGGVSPMTVVSYWSFSGSMKHIEASRSSVVLAMTPLITFTANEVFASILPHVLVSESLNTLSLAGAFLVVAGSVISAVVRKRRAPESKDGVAGEMR